MVKYESIPTPMFDGTNYVIWSSRMEAHLFALGYDVWMSVKNGYTSPTTPTKPEAKREYECNVEAKKIILSGLLDVVSSKVKKCKLEKIIWDRLKRIYGEEPSTTRLDCEKKKNNGEVKCEDDKRRSVSCSSKNKEETHLFMAHEVQNEKKTSKCENET